ALPIFRNRTELSSDWYWEQDETFRFTMVSDNLHRRLGPLTQSVIGKTRWELPTLNMTEADWTAHRALLQAHQPFRDLQWHRLDNSGDLELARVVAAVPLQVAPAIPRPAMAPPRQLGQAPDRQHQRQADLRFRGAFPRLPRDRPGHHREQAERGGIAALSRLHG